MAKLPHVCWGSASVYLRLRYAYSEMLNDLVAARVSAFLHWFCKPCIYHNCVRTMSKYEQASLCQNHVQHTLAHLVKRQCVKCPEHRFFGRVDGSSSPLLLQERLQLLHVGQFKLRAQHFKPRGLYQQVFQLWLLLYCCCCLDYCLCCRLVPAASVVSNHNRRLQLDGNCVRPSEASSSHNSAFAAQLGASCNCNTLGALIQHSALTPHGKQA